MTLLRLHSLPGGALAAVLLAACETPGPVQPMPAGPLAPREAMARYYPDVLARGMRGDEYVYFQVDARGRVEAHGIGRYGDPVSTVVAAFGRGPGVERRRTRPGELGPDAFDLVWVRATVPRQPQRFEMPPPGSRNRPRMMHGSYGELSRNDFDIFEQAERLARASVPDVVRRGTADGWVSLRFTVGTDGLAKELVVTRDVHPEVDAAARKVVERLRFTPVVRDGRPVEVVNTFVLDFNAFLGEPGAAKR